MRLKVTWPWTSVHHDALMMQDRQLATLCLHPRAIRMLVSITLTAMAFFSSQSYSPILLIHGGLDDAILRSGMTVQIMPSVRGP